MYVSKRYTDHQSMSSLCIKKKEKKIRQKCVQNEPRRVWSTFMYRFQDVFPAHESALELFPGNGCRIATQPISQRGMTVQFRFLFHSYFMLLCGNRLSEDSQVQVQTPGRFARFLLISFSFH